jgi:glycosyltransferase involved in cell wall biosynthesis
MNEKPLVSIVVPSYNRAQYVPATLDSILAQNYKNLELIFIDDGSTDDTAEILDAYSKRDSRIQYHHQNNSERAVARSKGMQLANGEYVCLVDSDDVWYPGKLEKQIAIMEKDRDIAMSYAAVNRIDMQGNSLGHARRQHQGYSGQVYPELLKRNFISSVTPMFRKELVNEVGEQRTDLIPYEDWDFWLRLSKLGKFHFTQEPLGDYRLHPGQSVKNVNAEHIEKVTLGVLDSNSKEADEQTRNEAYSLAHLRFAYWYTLAGKQETALEHLKKSFALSSFKRFSDFRYWALEIAARIYSVNPSAFNQLLGYFH